MEAVNKVPEGPTKSKEEILAERKAKKAEKAAKKSQPTKEPIPTTAKPATVKPEQKKEHKEPIQAVQQASTYD